jgi:CHAD domain-containing protein
MEGIKNHLARKGTLVAVDELRRRSTKELRDLLSGEDLEKEVARYASKRVRKLRSSFRAVVEKSDSEAVRDFRKETRELQTIVDACGIRRPTRTIQKIRRRLQKARRALGYWRDSDVMLRELNKAQRKARTKQERLCWSEVAKRIAKRRRRVVEKFFRNCKSLKVTATGAKAKALVKKKLKAKSIMDNLRLLLQSGWEKWNGTIDDFVRNPTAPELHAVRIKTKTLIYAIELGQKFYPDKHLASASEWLKDIQDRVGAWHDEFMLSQTVLDTFSKSPRDPSAIKILRELKEKEIAMAESARNFISSIRRTEQYQRLKRLLSASVYAMINGRDPAAVATDSITGPIQ